MKKSLIQLSVVTLIFGLAGFLPIQKALAQTINYTPVADVEFDITNTLSDDSIYVGDTVNMNYIIHNTGPDNLVTVHAVLTFPTALDSVSCGTFTCSYNDATRQLTLDLGDLISVNETITGYFGIKTNSVGTHNIDATLGGDSGRDVGTAWQVTAQYPVTVLEVAATPTATASVLPSTGADLQTPHFNFAEILALAFFPPAALWFKI